MCESTRHRVASFQAPYCLCTQAAHVDLRFALLLVTSPGFLFGRCGEPSFPKINPGGAKVAERAVGDAALLNCASRSPVVRRRRDLAVFRVLLHQRVRSSPVSPGLADTLMALCSSRADPHMFVWFAGNDEHFFGVPSCPRKPS